MSWDCTCPAWPLFSLRDLTPSPKPMIDILPLFPTSSPYWPLLLKPVPVALTPTLPFPKHGTSSAGSHPALGVSLLALQPLSSRVGTSLSSSWRHCFHPFVNHTSQNFKVVFQHSPSKEVIFSHGINEKLSHRDHNLARVTSE